MTAQIILSLSILVGLHEMGHLLAAKAFGMRVEQFSIGFPPKVFSFTYGETEYALSAIPLGGYVKISGMIDESLDTEAMSKEPQPWEFRSKPAWQRLIVMLGGIIVNVILGVFIFILMTFFLGDQYVPIEEINNKGGIYALDLGQEIGLKSGDKVLKINDEEFERFRDISDVNKMLEPDAHYTIERSGNTMDIEIPKDFIEKFNTKEAVYSFVRDRHTSEIGLVASAEDNEGEPFLAERIGLKVGDRIVEMKNRPIRYFDEVIAIVKEHDRSEPLPFKIQRGSEVMEFNPSMENDSIFGIAGTPQDFKTVKIDYTFAESFVKGPEKAFGVIGLQLKAFKKMFSGDIDPRKSLSGPMAIAKQFGGEWDWVRFWGMTGLLSMVLAFMNLLPIPALDGGHVMFLTYEIVSGRKPADKFLETAQKVGMILLLALMAFVIINDFFK